MRQVILLIAGNVKLLLIGRLAAVSGQTVVRMLLNRIFVVHHRAFTANKDKRLAVIQHPHLVRHEQFATCVLIIGAAGAAASLRHAARSGVDGGLAQQLRNVFVGAGLVAAQIEQCVAVAGHILPAVLEQLLELRHVLNDDIDGDIFAVIPDEDTTFNYLVGLMYSQAFRELYHAADNKYGGRLPVPVRVLMDEFANVALPEDFERVLATCRSREISLAVAQCAERQVIAAGQVRHFFRVERRQSSGCTLYSLLDK